jgi:hypothetical protein
MWDTGAFYDTFLGKQGELSPHTADVEREPHRFEPCPAPCRPTFRYCAFDSDGALHEPGTHALLPSLHHRSLTKAIVTHQFIDIIFSSIDIIDIIAIFGHH